MDLDGVIHDPKAEALGMVDKMMAGVAKARRRQRRMVLIGGGLIGLIGGVNLVAVAFTGPRLLSEVVALGALTLLGLQTSWALWQMVDASVEMDERYSETLKKQIAAEFSVAAAQPLLSAIREAHAKGESLTVLPADEDHPAGTVEHAGPDHKLN